MKTDEAIRREIRTALDRRFSGVVERPDSQQRMLRLIRGEEKIVKKKLSVAFVLVITLVLAAAVALAVVTIRETGRTIAQTERENGDYLDWPIEKRVQVVCELMDEGYIPETTERRQLRGTLAQDEAARIADAAIAEFTGEEAKYASFLSIMDAAWGPFGEWTHEQQAWYSRLMTEVGYETDGKTYYVEPTGPLTEQEAIDIAKREVMRVFGMEQSVMDQYRVESSFQIPEDAEPGDTKAYWYVMFDTWNTGLNADELPFSAVDMFVDPDTGKLREPLEELAAAIQAAKDRYNAPISQTIRDFGETSGEAKNFMHWSLENKAKWCAEIAPLIKAYEQEHPDDAESMFNWYERASVHHTYGLPDEQAIAQDKAIAISREALRSAYQLSDEELVLLIDNGDPYYICVYYDVTDPEKPLWKLFFEMPSVYCSDDALAARVKAVYGKRDDYDRFFKVELNAYTGEVLRTLNLRSLPDTLEEYIDIM